MVVVYRTGDVTPGRHARALTFGNTKVLKIENGSAGAVQAAVWARGARSGDMRKAVRHARGFGKSK